MFTFNVAIQTSRRQDAVIGAIRSAATSANFDQSLGAYAYASAGGALLLATELESSLPRWTGARKRWLISLDWGHTEPEALDYLASIPRSEVRIPNAAEVLGSSLVPRRCFHPKTLLLDQSRRPSSPPVMLAIGSANLTVSGMRFADEHLSIATWTSGRVGARAGVQLAAMRAEAAQLEAAWNRARCLTRPLLADYKVVRQRLRPTRRRNTFEGQGEDASRQVREVEDGMHFDFAKVAKLRASRHLWTEIRYVVPNRGPGVPGNQVDLAAGTRAYFGLDPSRRAPNTLLGSLRIRYGTHEAVRNMRFGNNSMDKLDLPIPGTDGPPTYRNAYLLFVREEDGSFTLQVGSPADVARWRTRSQTAGTSFKMAGGREWGVF